MPEFLITFGADEELATYEADNPEHLLAQLDDPESVNHIIPLSLRLYHWPLVETCAHYCPGDAIILAYSVEDARTKFKAALTKWVHQNHEWEFTYGDEEDRQSLFDTIERDVAKIPIMTDNVIIRGSD